MVRGLAKARARKEPPIFRRALEYAFLSRWWQILSVQSQRAFSASLMDVFEKEHYVPDELQPGPPIDTVLEDARYALGPTVSRMA